jgi:YfiH family protein
LKRNTHDGLVYYQFEQWSNLKHGIFTRKGGVSAAPWDALNLGGNVGDAPMNVRRNHELMYAALGVRGDHACTVWQIHRTNVIIAHAPVRGRRWLAAADALISDRVDIPLAMRFADCVPLMFFDPVRGVIGIAHAGWRGTVQGVGSNTVRAMAQAYGSRPGDLQAAIGPSIDSAHYQVGEEVVVAVEAYFGRADNRFCRHPGDGTAYLDLWTANQFDLEYAGVEQIEVCGTLYCRACGRVFLTSQRKGRTGRFGVVISL